MPTVDIHNVQSLRAFSEATFNTDASASLASFTYVPAREGTIQLELTTQSIDPGQVVQYLDEYRNETLGPRSAKLTFTLNLAPTGTAAVTGTSAVTGALGMLLKASMGTETKAAGSTSSTGSTATVVNVQSGHGSRWVAGGVMGWVNASGLLEVRQVLSVSADAITLKYGFSGSPVSTDPLYNAAVYTLAQNPTESLQFLVSGVTSTDRWLLTGGQLTAISLTLDPKGTAIPSIQFTYEFANYLESDETGSTVTGTLPVATYSNYTPIVGHAGELRMVPNGTTTLSTTHRVHASAISYAPKFAFERVTSPSGAITATSSPVLQWRRKRVAPAIEGSFTEPFQSLKWTQGRDARTAYACWYQLGRTAGQTVWLGAPTVQVVNPQRSPDAAGFSAIPVQWKGRLDAVTAATTDVGLSAFTIALV